MSRFAGVDSGCVFVLSQSMADETRGVRAALRYRRSRRNRPRGVDRDQSFANCARAECVDRNQARCNQDLPSLAGLSQSRTRTVLEIIIQGRGGQGAQTAGNLLAATFFAEGREVQSFATYGGARRGTPVSSFIRIDDRPVRVRCEIEQAHAILCFDATLLDAKLLSRAGASTLIVVNSAHAPDHFLRALPAYRVIPIDGLALSRRHGLGRIVNSALLGAFAAALDAPRLATLTRVITDETPRHQVENVSACEDGYRIVAEQMRIAA